MCAEECMRWRWYGRVWGVEPGDVKGWTMPRGDALVWAWVRVWGMLYSREYWYGLTREELLWFPPVTDRSLDFWDLAARERVHVRGARYDLMLVDDLVRYSDA